MIYLFTPFLSRWACLHVKPGMRVPPPLPARHLSCSTLCEGNLLYKGAVGSARGVGEPLLWGTNSTVAYETSWKAALAGCEATTCRVLLDTPGDHRRVCVRMCAVCLVLLYFFSIFPFSG